jgi:hypothetical protein
MLMLSDHWSIRIRGLREEESQQFMGTLVAYISVPHEEEGGLIKSEIFQYWPLVGSTLVNVTGLHR